MTPDLHKLRARDEEAFSELIDACTPMMTRLARAIVGAQGAEEVVQDAWIAAFAAIEQFEGRSNIRTWLGQIVLNKARTRARAEGRFVPLGDDEGGHPTHIDRLVDRDGRWVSPPSAWAAAPDQLLHRAEIRAAVEAAMGALPELQRMVVTLRDVEGFSAEETCHVLGVAESNQRQLLHRARLKLRATLEKAMK